MTESKKKKTVKAKKKVTDKKKKAPPAYFLSMTVENVRCFGPKQKIDFSNGEGKPTQWTVLLGDNNTGKTTILKSIIALEPQEINFPEGQPEGQMVPRFGSKLPLEMYLRFERGEYKDTKCFFEVDIFCGKELDRYNKCKYTSLDNDKNIEVRVINQINLTYSGVKDIVSVFCKYYDPELVSGLICYGYGANRRMGETSLSEYKSSETSLSLLYENKDLINAEEWLMQADYAAKSSSEKSKIGKKAKQKRDLIREVLVNLLPEIDDIQITEPTKARPKPRVEFKTPYGWVPVGGLSLGYKTMIAWMVDLASRLFDRYPNSKNPLAEPAVVLIDEIDLHMHPRWQRTIMDYLSERFVNTQFIVTAHSPLVVQSALDANVVLLRREGDHVVIENNPQSIQGWRLDQIMTSDLFGLPSARSPEVEKLQQERTKLLSKGKLADSDKKRLKELDDKLSAIPSAGTTEDIEAMEIIRKAARNLKKEGRIRD